MIHNFKYMFKTIMRVKPLVFWTFAFPIIMSIFFQLAFSNIENAETFNVIDIAVVDNEYYQNDLYMPQALSLLSDKESEQQLFNIKYVTEEKAKELLDDSKIDGYLLSGAEGNKIIISKNGINQTIFKSVIEEIMQNADIIETNISMLMANGDNSYDSEAFNQFINETVVKMYENQEVNLKNISNSNLSYTMIEFYTLIAMTCLYGGIIGMTAINYNLANISSNGRRVAMSPAKKGSVVISSLLAGYVVQLIGLAILFLFTSLVLKVDYGDNLPLVILLALAGSLAGLSLGVAVGILVKAGEGAKTGIIIAFSMLCSFFSGMMGITMKYIIDKNAPIVNKLNPGAMITDGLYSLYYYDTYDRYILNLVSLLIFSAVLIIISLRGLRRVQYDSI